MANHLFILIPNPSHYFGGGIDVWGRNILAWANHRRNPAGKGARQLLEFVFRQLGRVNRNPALAATERQVENGILPGHQRGEELSFRHVDVWVIAEAAFIRPPPRRMLNAVAMKKLGCPISLKRNRDFNNPLGRLKEGELIIRHL
jgi:hypothetical protein